MIKLIENTGEDLELENVKQMIFEFDKSLIKIIRFPRKKQFLIIIAKIKNNLGVIRLEIKKCLRDLSEYI